jgi:DNA helicase-2/ATP-dependent DNA helicase PcrA
MKPVLVTTGNPSEQAQFVSQRVLELRDEGIELDEMAVLYRSHFHCLELQMELTSRNIPFVITSGIRFFEQAHIKDVVALLKVLCNPRDEVSFKRVTMLLPGLGIKTADRIWAHFLELTQENPGGREQIPDRLTEVIPSIPKKSVPAWTQLIHTTRQMLTPENAALPGAQIHLVIDAFYHDYAHKSFENAQHRLDELDELANFAGQFESTEEFLGQLALLTELENENTEVSRQNNDDEKIRLSTVHQAKGLEFKVVFVIMMAEGLFPNYRALESEDGREEERRLFYVSVTRAKDQVYLIWPKFRETSGYGNPWQQPASFLLEVPDDLYEEWELD